MRFFPEEPLRFSLSLHVNFRGQGQVVYMMINVICSNGVVQGIDSIINKRLKLIVERKAIIVI